MFEKKIHVRWADLDPNFHLRHSAYYDLAAQFRFEYLIEKGFDTAFFQSHKINPILLKEECTFKREIRYGDEVTLHMEIINQSEDHAYWTIKTSFLRDGKLCAELTVFGAWFHVESRKISPPPADLAAVL